MAKRMWAASFIAILGTGLMLASDVSAGGLGGHRGAPGMGGLRAPVGKTVAHHGRAHARFNGASARLHHHRNFRPPLTGWWTTGYGGYYDSSSSTPTTLDRPIDAEPASSYPPVYTGGPYPAPYAAPSVPKPLDVIVYRPGCRSQSETIPWSDGKDRTIAIVRC
jgi:hypothetical protein